MPPRQLDYCDQCQAPIYMETVVGACTCDLGKLRALRAHLTIQQNERLAQIRSGVADVAPDFLATAIQATIDTRAQVLQPPQAPQPQQTSRLRGQPQHVAMIDDVGNWGSQATPSLDDIMMEAARKEIGQSEPVVGTTRETSGREPQRRAALPRISLESLWGTPDVSDEAREAAGIGLDDALVASADDDPGSDEIQFDMDFNFDTSGPVAPRMAGAREAVRFRVDRPPPQRERFVANLEPGPGDGEVVGNIRTRGMGIQEVRERARQTLASGATRREGPMTRQASAVEVQRNQGSSVQRPVKPDTRPRPTVYDRLRQPSPFDDD